MIGWPQSVALVGAGKMGAAMLEGWLRLGLPGDRITVIDPAPSAHVESLCVPRAIRLNPEVSAGAPEALVLAVKPQMLDAAVPVAAALAQPETLLISIIAGKTAANLLARLPQARAVVRAMPNTPAAVGRGITGVWANAAVRAAQRQMADAMLSAIGRVEWLDQEALIDAVTAVSGSGPAYVFYLTECLAKAAEAVGLPPEVAARLARATVEGSGELMFQASATPPSRLRENVTSPAGTTAAALTVLMEHERLQSLITRAVAAAKQRAAELSG
jgi:pyrroline-5-carboxylate reductase